MHFLISTVLSFMGLAAACAVLCAAALCFIRRKRRGPMACYMTISVIYAGVTLQTLMRQSSGFACSLTHDGTLFLYGGLLLLHVCFLLDCSWQMKKDART